MRQILAVLASSAWLLASSPGFAQPSPLPATPQGAAADTYYRGVRYFNKAEQTKDPQLYEAAYLQFVQSYAVYPSDIVLWNLSVAEVMTHRYVDGLKHLRSYDDHKHILAQPNHPERVLLMGFLEQATRATGHIEIDAPSGARLQVDGAEIGWAPLAAPVDVTPGPHAVDAVLAVGKTLHAELTAPAGETKHVMLSEPASPAGSAVPSVGPAPSGSSSPSAQAPESVARTPWPPPAGTLVIGTVGVIAVGLGVGFAVDSSSKNDSAAASRGTNPCAAPLSVACVTTRAAISGSQSSAAVSTGLYVGGGVALGAAVLWWVLAPRKRETVNMVPSAGAHGAGFSFIGDF